MSGIQFVIQPGTKDEDPDTRKLIRRHVMLGKNLGRKRISKQPTSNHTTRSKSSDEQRPDQPTQSIVPRKVGTDVSFVQFADTFEPSFIYDTLRFCHYTSENLFILEPCIAFDSQEAITRCLGALASDALYANVMVFGTRAYRGMAAGRAANQLRLFPTKDALHQYGKALCLLRERLADAERRQCPISDVTIMAVIPLAVGSLFAGDNDTARHHMVGLAKLVSMREDGFYSLRTKTKLMIELLRSDLYVSLATGHAPLFFQDPSHEPMFPLPEPVGLDQTQDPRIPIFDIELAKIWDAMKQFSDLVNEVAIERRKLSDQALLEITAACMYRLLSMPTLPGSIEEILRLAMLSLCAGALVSWRELQIPFGWLRLEYKLAITRLMQSPSTGLDPQMVLWFLMVYGITFSPMPANEREELQSWLTEATDQRALTTWETVKKALSDFLWIDIACNQPAQKLINENVIGRIVAIGWFDVLC